MKNIRNFRDIGNKMTPDGWVKSKLLYRGTALSQISQETLNRLQEELNIKTIIDLRDEKEVKKDPDYTQGFNYYHLNVIKDAPISASPRQLMTRNLKDPAHEVMVTLYKSMILNKHAQAMFREFFNILLYSEDAIYIHCSAGKDRTGLASYLLLKVLGVSDEDIMEDYLLSNEMTKHQVRQRILKFMADRNISQEYAKRLLSFLQVDKDYLQTAMDTITEYYGSFDEYVCEILNLNEEKILKLKAKYINGYEK